MQFRFRLPVTVVGLTVLLLLAGGHLDRIPAQQDPDAPGPPHETNLTVGELPPGGFALQSVNGETHDLEALRGQQALMIVFFRGTW